MAGDVELPKVWNYWSALRGLHILYSVRSRRTTIPGVAPVLEAVHPTSRSLFLICVVRSSRVTDAPSAGLARERPIHLATPGDAFPHSHGFSHAEAVLAMAATLSPVTSFVVDFDLTAFIQSCRWIFLPQQVGARVLATEPRRGV